MYFLRSINPRTMRSISGCRSGSPPGMLTTGDGLHAVFVRELGLQDVRGVLDLPATRAGEIAAVERLEHQRERVALATLELLLGQIQGHRRHLRNGYRHSNSPQPTARVGAMEQ